jgi:hypothetical protein
MSDSETFAFINTFRPEKAAEGLPGEQRPARKVWIELQGRLDRLGQDFGRPINQKQ